MLFEGTKMDKILDGLAVGFLILIIAGCLVSLAYMIYLVPPIFGGIAFMFALFWSLHRIADKR